MIGYATLLPQEHREGFLVDQFMNMPKHLAGDHTNCLHKNDESTKANITDPEALKVALAIL